MPEPTPTTDVATELKPGGKRFPKWGYFAIGGAVVIALLIYKSKKSKEEESVFQPAETGGQNLEEDFPVTGNGLGSVEALGKQNTEFLEKYLGIEQTPKPTAGESGNQPGRNGNGRTETKVHNPQKGSKGEGGGRQGNKPEQKTEEKPIIVEVPKGPPPTQSLPKPKPPKTKGKPPKLQPVGGNKPLS